MRHLSDVVLLYSTEFIREVALKTGIILDPVYTVKAAMGMVKELRKNPTRFRGRRILYLHTGERSMMVLLALIARTHSCSHQSLLQGHSVSDKQIFRPLSTTPS